MDFTKWPEIKCHFILVSLTPTVALNSLATRLGYAPVYTFLENPGNDENKENSEGKRDVKTTYKANHFNTKRNQNGKPSQNGVVSEEKIKRLQGYWKLFNVLFFSPTSLSFQIQSFSKGLQLWLSRWRCYCTKSEACSSIPGSWTLSSKSIFIQKKV